jgi:hypothetical protein
MTTQKSPRTLRKASKPPSDREYWWMRETLPYGWWVERDGSWVLFNRYYFPIWRRTPDGVVSRVDGPWRYGKIWINWVRQEYFYNDGFLPWHYPEVREFLEQEVLGCWFDVVVAPVPITKRRTGSRKRETFRSNFSKRDRW